MTTMTEEMASAIQRRRSAIFEGTLRSISNEGPTAVCEWQY
jgi:hypothetical protein